MQLATKPPKGAQGGAQSKRSGSLGRAIGYLKEYPRLSLGAVVALLIATAAQLAVPQLIQRIIDTIVSATPPIRPSSIFRPTFRHWRPNDWG